MAKETLKPLFTFSGEVIQGKGKGRTVGMPTVNLRIDPKEPVSAWGVYSAVVHLDDTDYLGVTNIGYRPSVDDERRVTVETYVIGLNDNIYGDMICIDLYHFLRPTLKLNSLEEVQFQVLKDCEATIEKMNHCEGIGEIM